MRDKNRKFTLIEVLLAVAIFAVIATLLAGILYSVEKSYRSIHDSNKELELRLRLESIADNCFRNAVPFYWQDKTHNVKKQIFFGGNDHLIFAYLHPAFTAQETGLRFIELFLEDSALYIRYRNEPFLYWENSDFAQNSYIEKIADGVKEIRFRYADKEKDEIIWNDLWDKELDDRIPMAILMEIEFSDGLNLKYLRRTAGNSYYSSYGKRISKAM